MEKIVCHTICRNFVRFILAEIAIPIILTSIILIYVIIRKVWSGQFMKEALAKKRLGMNRFKQLNPFQLPLYFPNNYPM